MEDSCETLSLFCSIYSTYLLILRVSKKCEKLQTMGNNKPIWEGLMRRYLLSSSVSLGKFMSGHSMSNHGRMRHQAELTHIQLQQGLRSRYIGFIFYFPHLKIVDLFYPCLFQKDLPSVKYM
jgi:hypothetical protein